MSVNRDDLKVLTDEIWATGGVLHEIRVSVAENDGNWTPQHSFELFEVTDGLVDDLKLFTFLFEKLLDDFDELKTKTK